MQSEHSHFADCVANILWKPESVVLKEALITGACFSFGLEHASHVFLVSSFLIIQTWHSHFFDDEEAKDDKEVNGCAGLLLGVVHASHLSLNSSFLIIHALHSHLLVAGEISEDKGVVALVEGIIGFIKASNTLPVFNFGGLEHFASAITGVDGVSGNFDRLVDSAGAGGLNLKLLSVLVGSAGFIPLATFIGSENRKPDNDFDGAGDLAESNKLGKVSNWFGYSLLCNSYPEDHYYSSKRNAHHKTIASERLPPQFSPPKFQRTK